MRLDHPIDYMLNLVRSKVYQLRALKCKPFHIAPEQWTLLRRLGMEDGITQKQLADLTEKDVTNIARILDQLEKNGLVKRVANAEDRRSFLLYLTEKGKALDAKMTNTGDDVVDTAFRGFSEAELEQLQQYLLRIADNVDQELHEED